MIYQGKERGIISQRTKMREEAMVTRKKSGLTRLKWWEDDLRGTKNVYKGEDEGEYSVKT